MALIDKQVEELMKYTGISPRPDDFDEFWDSAMQEMRSVDRNVELVKSDFQAPGVTCYDLYFTGVRNARIHCKFMVPENIKDKAPAVLSFHGYGGAISLVCASLEPRVSKIYVMYPFLCDYLKAWELNQTQASYADLFVYFRKFDPRHEREDEVFTKLGYIDVQNFTERIKGEVVMITGLQDKSYPVCGV